MSAELDVLKTAMFACMGPDTALVHSRRGKCLFKSVDEQDPSGATVWVYFPEDDEEVMVSVALLQVENDWKLK
jgi:hypothetical protein